jgi:hypothetical protein
MYETERHLEYKRKRGSILNPISGHEAELLNLGASDWRRQTSPQVWHACECDLDGIWVSLTLQPLCVSARVGGPVGKKLQHLGVPVFSRTTVLMRLFPA